MRRRIVAVAAAVFMSAGSAAMAQGWYPFKFGFGAGGGTIFIPTPCTSTGIYDLSNVCNDIYFIGALK